MVNNEMLAMILAGGRGSRLKDLTNKVAKPAISFGGKYRIVDFPLSNCANSGVSTVGVLTQYEPVLLNSYVAGGTNWGLDQYDPEYLLVLSGDHIYKMNYAKMLAFHKENKADATIAVIGVPMKEASRFGIMNTDGNGHIVEFEEKPEHPKSNLASMGIYIFSWKVLRRLLISDKTNAESSHDFGKDIIPTLLGDGRRLMAYEFKGYWKDVGTIDSLWQANMDLLDEKSALNLDDDHWKIYTEDATEIPQFIGPDASIDEAYITQGCHVEGAVRRSVVFTGANVGPEAQVCDSVLMPGSQIGRGAKVIRCLVANNVRIAPGATVGSAGSESITLVAHDVKEAE